MVFRVLICGDRNWTDFFKIRNEILALQKEGLIECIIEGEARGADSLARIAGQQLGINVLKFPANWDKHGKAAGPIRNKQMLDDGKPNLVLAFHSDIEKSKGTKNMVAQAQKAGIEFKIIK